MAAVLLGSLSWDMETDDNLDRTYHITWLVRCDAQFDGPFTVYLTAGLPLIGSTWAFGNDVDPWAWCRPELKVVAHDQKKGDPFIHWEVTQTFSTKPWGRCCDTQVGNPLSEPPKVSGSFARFTKATNVDANNKLILSSSLEQIKIERDESRPNVHISFNVANLNLPLYTAYRDAINDRILWGLSARMIKLSTMSWQRLVYGSCTFYYNWSLEFEINFLTWDRPDIDDVGFKRLKGTYAKDTGKWTTNPGLNKTRQDSYERSRDINGAYLPLCALKNGEINQDPAGSPQYLSPAVKLYSAKNLLNLGIPTSF